MSKPSGFQYGWVVVAAGALMTCIGMGAMLSLAVFLQPISESMGWSRGGGFGGGDARFPLHGGCSLVLGRAVRPFRHPHRGARRQLLLGLGLVTASQATSLWQFQLLFGILIGTAAGAFYAPMMAAASAWIESHRSLAVSLVSAAWAWRR